MWKPINLRDLRYFIVVAEEENLRRASKKLAIAQPALSRRIRDLEKTLEVSLFEREKQRIKLSHVGKAFLSSAYDLMEQTDAAIEDARRIARGDEGKLSIAITEFAIRDDSVKRILRWFSESYPNVNITFEPMTGTPLTTRIDRGDIDFAFVTFLSNEILHFPHMEVSYHEFSAAVRADSAKATADHMSIFDFHDQEIIWFQSRTTPGVTEGLKKIFKDAGINLKFKPMFMTENGGLHLVSAGLGMAILPRLQHNYLSDSVSIKRIIGLDVGLNLVGMWNPGTENPVVDRLIAGMENLLGKSITVPVVSSRGGTL